MAFPFLYDLHLGFQRRTIGASLLPLLVLGGCSLNLGLDDDALDNLGRIEICDGLTLEELINAKTISEGCKSQVQALLPEPEDNFSDRLIVLGQKELDDGSLAVYVQAVNDEGQALDAETLATLSVSIEVDGAAELLAESELSLNWGDDLPTELLSIGFVNDYSGSMSTADLRVTGEIETDLINVLPDIFEGEVTLFSTEVSVKQTFTDDRNALLDAVAYDEDFEQDLTALYDGMGTGLTSLIERQRPLRLLVVATDGQENSSTSFERAQLIQTIADENVCVLMLGSLFSDPNELRSFTQPCGAFFYTRGYSALRSAVSEYVASLGQMTEIVISADARGQGQYLLEVDGLSTTITDQ